MRYRVLFCLALLGATLGSALSAQSYTLLLKHGPRVPAENAEAWSQSPDLPAADRVAGRFYRMIQFYDLPTQPQREAMEAAGMRFLEYLPKNAYRVSFPQNFDFSKLPAYGVRAVWRTPASDKIEPRLFESTIPAHAQYGADEVQLTLHYPSDMAPVEVLYRLRRLNLPVLDRYDFGHYVVTALHPSELYRIGNLPFVAYLERIAPPPVPENFRARTSIRSNVLIDPVMGGSVYNGTGVDIAITDNGLIGPHIDFKGRIASENTTQNTGNHGDHVSGTAAGAGNLNPVHMGMAPGADLHIYRGTGIYNALPNAYNAPQNVRITSSSQRSVGCNAGYTTEARTADQQIATLPSLMHVFSAGNSGNDPCGGIGNGWRTITGGNKMGKNGIAVGNLTIDDQINSSSSRGPAYDNRVKPDICAVGTDVTSTIDTNDYATFTGTSMACPGVSGLLAQLYDAYGAFNGGQEPDGGLMKAILLNTADDLGNPGPDYTHGWGRANGRRALNIIEQERWFDSTITNTSVLNIPLTVPPSLDRMKVMVYWTDPAASIMASKALVNDLDIRMSDPMGTFFEPYVLDAGANPTVVSVQANATTGVDTLNNMEQVEITSPIPGTYTLQVFGTSIPSGPQKFYVVYEFIESGVAVTFPASGEAFVPQEVVRIRWDAFGGTGNFSIDFSANGGTSWNNIGNAPAGRRYFDWQVPATLITGEGKIRVTQGGNVNVSPGTFTVIPVPQNLAIERVCQNFTRLTWDPVGGATEYEVFMLGNKYMESQGTTTAQTFDVMAANWQQENWFAVRAIAPAATIVGRRSIAIKADSGLFRCAPQPPIPNFDAPQTACLGTPITLQDQSQNAPEDYLWIISPPTFSFVNGTSDTDPSPQIQLSQDTIYTVMLITSNFAGTDTIIKTINAQFSSPTGAFIAQPGGLDVIFISQTPGAFSWRWDFGDGTTSTLQNPTHTYDSSGTYNVSLTVSNPCGTFISRQTVNIIGTGLGGLPGGAAFSLAPNPSNGRLALRWQGWSTDLTLQLIDVRGRVVARRTLDAGGRQTRWNLDDLDAGIYLLRLRSGSYSGVQRIVIR